MQKQFKVGQVWLQRGGGVDAIRSIDDDENYPINGTSGESYTATGQWHTSDKSNERDLVKCIYDGDEAPKPPLAKFDRDQMAWEIYRDCVDSKPDQASASWAYECADYFLVEMAKQHGAKQ